MLRFFVFPICPPTDFDSDFRFPTCGFRIVRARTNRINTVLFIDQAQFLPNPTLFWTRLPNVDNDHLNVDRDLAYVHYQWMFKASVLTLFGQTGKAKCPFRIVLIKSLSGEVGRSWRYCNTRPTRDRAGASSWISIPLQKSV